MDIVDYLLVTFLRTAEPGAFAMMKRYRADLTGAPSKLLMPRQRPEEKLQVWRDRVAAAGVAEEHREGVLSLFAVLFKPVSDALGTYGASANADQRRGVGSNDYFDRYTMFSVPDDDQTEADFAAAIQQLASGDLGPEYTVFLEHLRGDTHRVARRLRHRRDTVPVPQLLALLANEVGTVSAPAEALGLLGAESAVRFLAYDLFPAVPEDERTTVLELMAATAPGTILATQILHSMFRSADDAHIKELAARQDLPPWAVASRDILADKLGQHMRPASQQPADQLDRLQRDTLLFWNALSPNPPEAGCKALSQRASGTCWTSSSYSVHAACTTKSR